eukprot:365703-Chlamydomonas_euryale.AAC.8
MQVVRPMLEDGCKLEGGWQEGGRCGESLAYTISPAGPAQATHQPPCPTAQPLARRHWGMRNPLGCEPGPCPHPLD